MAELFQKLVDLFQIRTIDFEKAARKTLDRWLNETEFQKRRERFYECCEDGEQKSKVALCRQEERPEYTKLLKTMKTKEIRSAIVNFLQDDLKILNSSVKPSKKIARKLRWEKVLFLSDDKKKGSGLESDEDEPEETKETEAVQTATREPAVLSRIEKLLRTQGSQSS